MLIRLALWTAALIVAIILFTKASKAVKRRRFKVCVLEETSFEKLMKLSWCEGTSFELAKKACELASSIEECEKAYREFACMDYQRQNELEDILFKKWDTLAMEAVRTTFDWADLHEKIENMRYGSEPWKVAQQRLAIGNMP
ncbi:MAG: hypothetical protein JWN50_30 [Parcubacteria group bacterium]|nr:hypothetical protein [Parcubacteria group bacterium]